jgi:hypothetical protein
MRYEQKRLGWARLWRPRWRGLWACLLLWLNGGLWPLAFAAAPPPLRILPLGDSITEGTPVLGGYREPLYRLLTNAGYRVSFVGTCSNSEMPNLPEPHHEGHACYRIEHLDAGFCAWANAVPDPDVILLLIGVNDFAQNQDPQHAIDRLDHLIWRIVSNRPAARLIVANLILRTDYPDIDPMIQKLFNPFVPGLVARYAAAGSQVSFLDLRPGLLSSDLADGIHPNPGGCCKLATNWFSAITNLVSPLGDARAPSLAHVRPEPDWQRLTVSFSKPVDDAAASPDNYFLSDGLKVIGAALDPVFRREVTLTTTPQIPSHTYVLGVSNVGDLTASHRRIASGASLTFVAAPTAGALNNVPEATNYTLVYSLTIPVRAAFNLAGVPYDVDCHQAVRGFRRVAYYLELQPTNGPLQFAWVSMDAFTDDPGKIGVPAPRTGAFFQRFVTNMNVLSNVRGLAQGAGLAGGYLEFWPSAYRMDNAAGVARASSLLYDWGDQPIPGEYGSLQIHNIPASQTIFAFNHWANAEGGIPDLGIGNSPSSSPDWTRAANAADYSRRLLQVFVLPDNKGQAGARP